MRNVLGCDAEDWENYMNKELSDMKKEIEQKEINQDKLNTVLNEASKKYSPYITELPIARWIYSEDEETFYLATKYELQHLEVGSIIITYHPQLGFNLQPQLVNKVWIDEFNQVCYTSVDYTEYINKTEGNNVKFK